MILGYPQNQTKSMINNGAWGVSLIGNICVDGSNINDHLINNANISVGVINPTCH